MQFGSMRDLGSRCRGFESRHSDHCRVMQRSADQPHKLIVAGSNPVPAPIILRFSQAVRCLPLKQESIGSNPIAAAIKQIFQKGSNYHGYYVEI